MSPMPRKEIEQHKLEGTKPHYIDPASDVPAGRPKFPKNFTPEMKQTFKKICRLLEKRKTVTPGDAELIRIFCIALARQNRALAHINAEGEITTYIRLDNNGQPHDVVKENLWLKVCTDAEKLQLSALDRLGLTPLNRGKIKPTKDDAPRAELPTREETELPEPDVDLSLVDTTVN